MLKKFKNIYLTLFMLLTIVGMADLSARPVTPDVEITINPGPDAHTTVHYVKSGAIKANYMGEIERGSENLEMTFDLHYVDYFTFEVTIRELKIMKKFENELSYDSTNPNDRTRYDYIDRLIDVPLTFVDNQSNFPGRFVAVPYSPYADLKEILNDDFHDNDVLGLEEFLTNFTRLNGEYTEKGDKFKDYFLFQDESLSGTYKIVAVTEQKVDAKFEASSTKTQRGGPTDKITVEGDIRWNAQNGLIQNRALSITRKIHESGRGGFTVEGVYSISFESELLLPQ